MNPEELTKLKSLLGRDPNSTEIALMEQLWSEHCSYKSSRFYLKTFSWRNESIVMGVQEWGDAGAFKLDDGTIVVLKLESHNHPSALDPFNGAATGVGGVIRDVISVGARPVALLDMLRVGPITDRRSREILRGVVKGIGFYGNSIGVPVIGGELSFDSSYLNNPLVDVACVGVSTHGLKSKTLRAGQKLVIVGLTGLDGMGGASFASKPLDGQDQRGAIQIADPFSGKIVMDKTLQLMDLVDDIKDLGAGGIGVAILELVGELGAVIDLSRVPLRVKNMTPEQVLVSETQERMIYVIEPSKVEKFCGEFRKVDYACEEIGEVTAESKVTFIFEGKVIASIPNIAVKYRPISRWSVGERREPFVTEYRNSNLEESILSVLKHEDLVSKEWVYSQYDYEVLASTIIRPGWADASVIRLPNGKFLALKGDANPDLCQWDAFRCAKAIFAEAFRNLSTVGAKPRAAVDHLQFGSPASPGVYRDFIDSVYGLAEASKFFNVPIVGGKVSFYNEDSNGNPIKPTPLVVMAGITERRPPKFQVEAGDSLLLLGFTRGGLGGSLYQKLFGGKWEIPDPILVDDLRASELVSSWVNRGLVRYAKDVGKGGLVGALIPIIKESLGVTIEIDSIIADSTDPRVKLFSESGGRFLLVGDDSIISEAEENGIHCNKIGQITEKRTLRVGDLEIELQEVISSYHSLLEERMN